jgi:hypothetical protein
MPEFETKTVKLSIDIVKPVGMELNQMELEIILARTVEYFRNEFQMVLQQKKLNEKLN